MVPALLLALGCWRPVGYEPSAAPPPPDQTAEGDVPEGAPGDLDGAAAGDPPGEPSEEAWAEPSEVPSEEAAEATEGPPPFPDYTARTIQAPVTLVDDYGKTLAVLDRVGIALTVTGEEEIRARVLCATCTPPTEGWIQPHLVARTGESPPDGAR